jgi:hypothetical protein
MNREVFNDMSNEEIAPAFVYRVGNYWFCSGQISDRAFFSKEDACEVVVKFFESEFGK